MNRLAHLRIARLYIMPVLMILAMFGYITAAQMPSSLSHAASTTAHGYGFATNLAGLSATDLESRLDAMQTAGATWTHTDPSWAAVQSGGPSSYDWGTYDRVASAATAHNIQLIYIIDFTPAWARPSDCQDSKLCAPANADAYATFAAAAAAHFSPFGVHTWEIWNEPNISYRYHPAPNPVQYVAMLQAAYTAIKKVDAGADVIAASTAPSATDSQNYTPLDFLTALYANGAHGYFTAISAHPYTYPSTPLTSTPSDAWGQLATMHTLMASYGDGDKQIWVTEFGAPTNGPQKYGEFVSEADQAEILSEAISELKRDSWSGPLLWYDYQDSGTSTATSENFYGLVRADGTHKPSYDVFRRAAKP